MILSKLLNVRDIVMNKVDKNINFFFMKFIFYGERKIINKNLFILICVMYFYFYVIYLRNK